MKRFYITSTLMFFLSGCVSEITPGIEKGSGSRESKVQGRESPATDTQGVPAAAPVVKRPGGEISFEVSGRWSVPPGITSLKVELWGGNGKPGANQGSGGGGGGAYVSKDLLVNAGEALIFTIEAPSPEAGGDVTLGTLVAGGGKPGGRCITRNVRRDDGSVVTVRSPGSGGVGGKGAGGDINQDGQSGTRGGGNCSQSGQNGTRGGSPQGLAEIPMSESARIKFSWGP